MWRPRIGSGLKATAPAVQPFALPLPICTDGSTAFFATAHRDDETGIGLHPESASPGLRCQRAVQPRPSCRAASALAGRRENENVDQVSCCKLAKPRVSADQTPSEVFATTFVKHQLLEDEKATGLTLVSSSIGTIVAAIHGPAQRGGYQCERRSAQRRHPVYQKPELLIGRGAPIRLWSFGTNHASCSRSIR